MRKIVLIAIALLLTGCATYPANWNSMSHQARMEYLAERKAQQDLWNNTWKPAPYQPVGGNQYRHDVYVH